MTEQGDGHSVRPLEQFLRRVERRSLLSPEERSAVLALEGELINVPGRRDIVRPGRKVQHSTLMVDGLSARFDQMADGRRQTTALHIPGDMCDLHSVAVPVAGWGIEALTASTIVEISHEQLKALAIRYPNLGLAFWREAVVDGSILAKWISALGRREAKARLAHLYCEMGIRLENAGRGSRRDFQLQMTQSQLAEVLGISPVHLNRSLQILRSEGLVVVEGAQVHVLNPDGLRQVAEFDPDYLLLDTGAN